MQVEDYKQNYITGWIKLFRSVKNHWLWSNGKKLTYFEAWILILIEVNHDSEKCLIDGELIDCNRGEKLYSLQTWCKLFNWSIQNVRTFFKLLEKDNMIKLKGLRKTTRLTVCNYDIYQQIQQTANTQLTHSQQTANTQLTTIKELKNEKNIYLEKVYFEKSKEIDEAFKDYLRLRIKHKYTMTDRAIDALVKKLRELSNGNVKDAIKIIDNAIVGKWKSFYTIEK